MAKDTREINTETCHRYELFNEHDDDLEDSVEGQAGYFKKLIYIRHLDK